MKRAQISLFIILGLVILITVGVLIMARQTLTPPPAKPAIEESLLNARTCLAQSTQAAIAALKNDGLITTDEGGPIPVDAEDNHYLLKNPNALEPGIGSNPQYPMGLSNYWGLCDRNGPNAIGEVAGRRYPCGQELYAYLQTPSIQEQLQITINRQMNECLNQSGHASVVMQDRAVVTRWDDPEIQHTEQTRLMGAWRAIKEVVEKEVLEPTHETLQSIECCEGAEIREGDDNGAYDILIDGEHITTIHLQNRNIGLKQGEEIIERPEHLNRCGDGDSCEFWVYDEDGISAQLIPEITHEDDPLFRWDVQRFPPDQNTTWTSVSQRGCAHHVFDVRLSDGNGYQTLLRNVVVAQTALTESGDLPEACNEE